MWKIVFDNVFIVYILQEYMRHNTAKYQDLQKFFTEDLNPRQKQYEALRALAFGEGSLTEIAQQFHYSVGSLQVLVSRLRSGKHILFPPVKKGPTKRHTPSDIQERILFLRSSESLSSRDIANKLAERGITIGVRTVERVLKDAGFAKLRRRTYREMGLTRKGTQIPKRATPLNPLTLKPFRVDCPVAGIYFFLPYIMETGILDIVKRCELPESSTISSTSAALSMLLLKLIGVERLSHIRQYDMEPSFGVFAGLSVLPKPSYINTYSYRMAGETTLRMQKEIISTFMANVPTLYEGKTINLDFHSIPHFGDESQMEKVWCGSRGKALKGANTFFATDGESSSVLYTKADVLRKEGSGEIKNFIDYLMSLKGVVNQTLVFDSKLTRYSVLGDLDKDGIKFITLRKRSDALSEHVLNIGKDEWKKVQLPIPKRKHQRFLVYEEQAILKDCDRPFRQIIIKDHGRAQPTFVVTNQYQWRLTPVLEIYARRWRIENKLGELVKFFSLNTISSPVMVSIHFDILWTIIADTLYHTFAQDLRRFETLTSQSLFKRFIDMPGMLVYDGRKFQLKIRKRAHTPILLGVNKLRGEMKIPWLNHIPLEIIWTA